VRSTSGPSVYPEGRLLAWTGYAVVKNNMREDGGSDSGAFGWGNRHEKISGHRGCDLLMSCRASFAHKPVTASSIVRAISSDQRVPIRPVETARRV